MQSCHLLKPFSSPVLYPLSFKKFSGQRETVETKKICMIDVGSSECKKDDLLGLDKKEHGAGGGGYEQDESLPDLDGPGVPLHPAEYVSAAILLGKKRLI